MSLPATPKPGGVLLHVRLTPKASSARVAGVEAFDGKPVLKAYVTTPPEDGKANAALVVLIAGWLGVPKSTVSMAAGQKSRLKTVSVAGDADDLLAKIALSLDKTG